MIVVNSHNVLPIVQSVPFQPKRHVQTRGAIQIPPLAHTGIQTAKVYNEAMSQTITFMNQNFEKLGFSHILILFSNICEVWTLQNFYENDTYALDSMISILNLKFR